MASKETVPSNEISVLEVNGTFAHKKSAALVLVVCIDGINHPFNPTNGLIDERFIDELNPQFAERAVGE